MSSFGVREPTPSDFDKLIIDGLGLDDPAGTAEELFNDRHIAVVCPQELAAESDLPAPNPHTFYTASIDEARDRLKRTRRSLLLLHPDAFDNDAAGRLASEKPSLRHAIVAVLGFSDDMGKAVQLAARLGLNFVFPGDCLLYPKETARWTHWIDLGGAPEGLMPHLRGGTLIHHARIRNREDKDALIGEVMRFLPQVGSPHALHFDLRMVLEEGINNAIFHAMEGEDGRPKYRPQDFVTLAEDEEVTVSWGADDSTIGVAIVDNQGRLTRETIFDRLNRQFGAKGLLDQRGRGVYLTYNLAERLIFNLNAQRRTELVILFRVNPNAWPDASAMRPILIFEKNP